MYGSAINGTSLEDDYSDLAVIDTMFPGIMVPNRVWAKINQTLIQNISASGSTTVKCKRTEDIFGGNFSYCQANRTCDTKSWLNDIYLYFNATNSDNLLEKNYTQYILTLKKENYAVDVQYPYFNASTNETT